METKYQKFPGKHFSIKKISGFTVNLKFFRKNKKGCDIGRYITIKMRLKTRHG